MAPSNHVPWIIIGVSFLSCMLLMFFIRVLLARENKRRDMEPRDDSFDNAHIVRIDEDGNRIETKVSKVCVHFHIEAYALMTGSCDCTTRNSWI